MKLAARAQSLPGAAAQWNRGEPLWQRVPKVDACGHPCIDFMMFAPRFNRRPAYEQESAVFLLRTVLAGYGDRVVFADLNLKINVLWVSLENRPGLMSELVAAVRRHVPEFHLVGHNPHAGT